MTILISRFINSPGSSITVPICRGIEGIGTASLRLQGFRQALWQGPDARPSHGYFFGAISNATAQSGLLNIFV